MTMARPEPPDSHVAIPIAHLRPDIEASGDFISGLVTLVWPYSASKKEVSLLLVEPDFRLRRKNGQVRIIFHGVGAKAIAGSGLNSGDKVLLYLRGSRYEKARTTIATPGRGIEWDLHFHKVLHIRVERGNQEPFSTTIDHPPSSPERSPSPLPLTHSDAAELGRIENSITEQAWDSPAFLKRKRISSLPYFESAYDPFSIDPDTDPSPLPKKSKYGRKSGEWTFAERTPSPEDEDEFTRSTSPSKPRPEIEPVQSPLTPMTIAYITAPPSDEDGPARDDSEKMESVSQDIFVEPRGSSDAGNVKAVQNTMNMRARSLDRIGGIQQEEEDARQDITREPEIEPLIIEASVSSNEFVTVMTQRQAADGGLSEAENEPRLDILTPDTLEFPKKASESTDFAVPIYERSYVEEEHSGILTAEITAEDLQTNAQEALYRLHESQSSSDLNSTKFDQRAFSALRDPSMLQSHDHLIYGLDGSTYSRFQSQEPSTLTSTLLKLQEGRGKTMGSHQGESVPVTDPLRSQPLGAAHMEAFTTRLSDDPIEQHSRAKDEHDADDVSTPKPDLELNTDDHQEDSEPEADSVSIHTVAADTTLPKEPDVFVNTISDDGSSLKTSMGFVTYTKQVLKSYEDDGHEEEEEEEEDEEEEEEEEEGARPANESITADSLESSKSKLDEAIVSAGGTFINRDRSSSAVDKHQGKAPATYHKYSIKEHVIQGHDQHGSDKQLISLGEPTFQSDHDKLTKNTVQEKTQGFQASPEPSNVEIVNLKDDLEDEQQIMAITQGQYIYPVLPQEVTTQGVEIDSLPEQSQHKAVQVRPLKLDIHEAEAENLNMGRNPDMEYSKSFEGDGADTTTDQPKNQMDSPKQELREAKLYDDHQEPHEATEKLNFKALVDQTEQASLATPNFAFFDHLDDFRIPEQDEIQLDGGDHDLASRTEGPAQVASSPELFVPDDDFVDMSRYSDIDEPSIVHEPALKALEAGLSDHDDDQGEGKARLYDEPTLPESTIFQVVKETTSLTTNTNLEDDQRAATGTGAREPDFSNASDAASDIPVDPSLLAKAGTHLITPDLTQETTLMSEASRLSIRSLSPPPPQLPTPSLTQSASNKHIPEPQTPSVPRTSSVIEKLKSRSADKNKKRTSGIAPIISPWFAPRKSSQITPDFEARSSSYSIQRASNVDAEIEEISDRVSSDHRVRSDSPNRHHHDQVVDVEDRSNRFIPDSEEERGEIGSEANEDILYSEEEAVEPGKDTQKSTPTSKELWSVGASERKAHGHPPSLPGLRTPLSYFAPLSTISSYLSTSISTLSILASSTKSERAKKGPRDYTMTFYISDPSLHQRLPSPSLTPCFKSSRPPSTVTVNIFRPHNTALPTPAMGDAILLRNFKITSLKGKMGLLSTESSAWVVFKHDKTWDPEVRGPPVEFGPEERAYASGLGRWWDSVKSMYENQGKGKEKEASLPSPIPQKEHRRRKDGKHDISPSPAAQPLRHELRDGKKYIDDPSTLEDARSERRNKRQSTHVLRDGLTYRDDV